MSHQPHAQQPNDQAPRPAPQPRRNDAGDDSLATLRRIEQLLDEIRGRLDIDARARRHRQFSLARLLGALLQALVVGLVIAGLADWVYGAALGTQLIKLVFAGVLQLGALTAFVIARDNG